MIVTLALAATLAQAPIDNPDDPCFRPKPIPHAAPRPKHTTTVQHKPYRLFKTEPKRKDEEAPCAPPARPPVTALPPVDVPDVPMTSIPEQPLENMPPEFPLLVVTPLEDAPPEGLPLGGGGAVGGGGSDFWSPPGITPAVPEPQAYTLILLGLAGVARFTSKPKKPNFSPKQNDNS